MKRPSGATRRARFWSLLVGGYVLLLFAAIVISSGRWLGYVELTNSLLNSLSVYWITCGGLWLMLSALVCVLRHRPRQEGKSNPARVAVWILVISLIARVLTIWTTEPRLSDDIWRYIHDGTTFAIEGQNPYALSPEEKGIQEPVNHPWLITIYQPTSQWVFAGLARIRFALAGPSSRLESAVGHRVFRFGFVLFDLLVIGMLLAKLRRENQSLWWSVLWAWHPLVIFEVAASGHQDVIGIACMVAALLLLDQRRVDEGQGRAISSGRVVGAGVAFALAVGVKPVVAPLALPLAYWLRHRPGRIVLAAIAVVATLAVLYAPFVLLEGGVGRMIETGRIFARDWQFNSAIFLPVANSLEGVRSSLARTPVSHLLVLLGPFNSGKGWSTLLIGIVLLIMLGNCMRRDLDPWRTAMIYLFASLLLSSTVHPWYLLWSLVLLPVRFNLALWILGITISWSYAALIDPKTYQVPTWVLVTEYTPVFGTLLFQAIGHVRRMAKPI